MAVSVIALLVAAVFGERIAYSMGVWDRLVEMSQKAALAEVINFAFMSVGTLCWYAATAKGALPVGAQIARGLLWLPVYVVLQYVCIRFFRLPFAPIASIVVGGVTLLVSVAAASAHDAKVKRENATY